ncbi:MAG: STAS domain-containing protein, partial [Acidimicrobiales bacterium]
ILVSVGTFDWHSVKPARLRRMPKTETLVTVVVVIVVVATSNLAIGVVVGVILSALFFARRVAHLTTFDSVLSPDGDERMYRIVGDLFFAATDDLTDHFDYDGDPDKVVIDLSDAHVWDASAVAALDAVTARYKARGKHVEILGLNPASAELHGNLAGHLTTSH